MKKTPWKTFRIVFLRLSGPSGSASSRLHQGFGAQAGGQGAQSCQNSSQHPGFMLLYVSMVLAFVLIIVLLAVPQLGFIKRHVVRWEVENMRSFITYVHRVALATGQDQTIYFDRAKNKISGAGREYQLAPGTTFGIKPGVLGPPASPHTPLDTPITFQDNKIVCYAQGTLDAGTVYITDDKASWLYALSLSVSPLCYVRTYFFDGSWKRCI